VNTAHFRYCTAVFAIALINGCSPRSEIIKTDLLLSPSSVITKVNSLPASIRTFTAAGSIDVQTPQMAQSAGFDIAVKKSGGSFNEDSVRLIIEGPFGITVGKALFTRSTFTVYNALSNIVYEGDMQKGLHVLPNINSFNPELLIDAVSGVRRFDDSFMSPDSFYKTDNAYNFIFTTDSTKILFAVDGISLRITSVKTFSKEDVLLREESYSYSQSKEGIWQPSQARIAIPEKSVSMEIYFDDVAINPGIEALIISFPDDAERVMIN